MTAPAIAYTDPTNISHQPGLAQFVHPSTPGVMPQVPSGHLICYVIVPVEQQIVSIARMPPREVEGSLNFSPTPAPVPRPPVGRMLINTFPSIYKERTGSVGLAAVPRVFPPIYLEHTITD